MALARNAEACLRRLRYFFNDDGALVVSDQKFARDATVMLPTLNDRFPHASIVAAPGTVTVANAEPADLCEILTSVLRCTPVTLELFENNRKNRPMVVPRPSEFHSHGHYVQSPYTPQVPVAPSHIAPGGPPASTNSLPYVITKTRADGLVIKRPEAAVTIRLMDRPPIAGAPPPPALEVPDLMKPPALDVPDFAGAGTNEPRGFEVDASLSEEADASPTASRKSMRFVKFGAAPALAGENAEINEPQFAPEPLIDGVWKSAPPPVSNVVAVERRRVDVPILTKMDVVAASLMSQRSRIGAQYPFLKVFDSRSAADMDSGRFSFHSQGHGDAA